MSESWMRWIGSTAVLAILAVATTAWAQTTAPAAAPAETAPASQPAADAAPPAPKPPADPIEAFIAKTKVIIPDIWTWGADARLRDEWFINAAQLNRQANNNEEHYQRYRARWWTSITPIKDVEFYTRFTWEGRNYCSPITPSTSNTTDPWHQPHRGWMDERDEVIIDNLYLKLSNIGGSPFTVQAGRFDLNIGSGWLMGDGGPLDGSRTFYFDGVRVITDLKDIKTTIDTAYVYVDAQGDSWFPKLKGDEIPALMTEQDEHGAFVYVTNKSLPHTSIEPYFFYYNGKHENYLKSTNFTRVRTGYDADIYTFGLRVAGDIGKNWKYSTEVAGQFGHRNATGTLSQDQCALGSFNRLSYLLNDKWSNEFYVDYEYLSGDKDSTKGTYEGFNVLWGRYPLWDELYGMAYIPETRVYQYENLHRISPGWKAKPLKDVEVGLRYDLMFCSTNPRENTGIFADGCFRGQMITPYFKWTIAKWAFTRVMPAFFFPGDYYAKSNNDPSTFFRWEIVFTW